MLTKGDTTRIALLKIARELFSEKGYSAVTMKDFAERSGLSRGGLYRHFASTKEIFIAMLDYDRESSSEELDAAIAKQMPARQLLLFFFNRQKQEIQEDKGRLALAIYEFCATETDQRTYVQNRFEAAVNILSGLIRYGQARHEFVDGNPEEIAQHLIIFWEGFKLSSAVIAFSETMIEKQAEMMVQKVALHL
jgi:AcrR family transcriptional regulator